MMAKLAIDGETREAVIQNMSLGGAQLAYPERLPVGKRVLLAFELPGREQAIEVGATVRWSSPDSLGLQFEGLRARDVWSLNKYFESLG